MPEGLDPIEVGRELDKRGRETPEPEEQIGTGRHWGAAQIVLGAMLHLLATVFIVRLPGLPT